MSERRTYADVERQFSLYAGFVRAAGMLADDERLALQQGSPSAGRAWRIHTTGGRYGSGLANPPEGSDYLGWSAAEAWGNLRTRCDAIYGVLHHLGVID